MPFARLGIKEETNNIKAIESFSGVINHNKEEGCRRDLPTLAAKYTILCRTNKLSSRPEAVRY
jgi:hypothetical protein